MTIIDYGELNRRLLADSVTLLREWLPGGRVQGHEYVCASIKGGAGNSFKVNRETGVWKDFATDDPGGPDLPSLYAGIHNIRNSEAAIELEAKYRPAKSNGSRINGTHHSALIDLEPINWDRPPNAEIKELMFRHLHLGLPSRFWAYRDAMGPIGVVVARHDIPGERKQIVPWIYNGLRWIPKAPNKPRPLYGLDRLERMPGVGVIVVEGEPAADSAQRYFPTRPCITWNGGANSVAHADWTPLEGRVARLLPDNDNAGRGAMDRLAEILLSLGCDVSTIDWSEFPGTTEGWDLADAEREGRAPEELTEYVQAHVRHYAPPIAQAAATLPEADQQPTNSQWKDRLRKRTDATPLTDVNNVLIALEFAPELSAMLRYNEFADKIEFASPPPWADKRDTQSCKAWVDEDRIRLQAYLQGQGLLVNRDAVVQDAVVVRAKQFAYHPVRDYLRSLTWDGRLRLDSWLTYYLGCEVNPEYLRAIGPRFLISAVARVMDPGCKADCILVLEATQGTGKSSAAQVLAHKEWFSDSLPDLHSKDAAIQLQGRWIQELAELAALGRSEIESMKAFASRQTDIYRPPYGRNTVERPRHCVFIATTNLAEYLADETGGRRFWPVRCGKNIDLEALRHDRDQLWAEALSRFDNGEAWHLTPELEQLAETEQSLRRLVPEHEERLNEFLDNLVAAGTKETTMHELLLRVGNIDDFTKQRADAGALGKMFSRILTKRGWIKYVPIGRGPKRRLVYGYRG